MKLETNLQSLNNERPGERESSVVKNILIGDFQIKYVSDILDNDEFKNSGHLANRYNYEISVPSPINSSQKWQTSLSIYWPKTNNERFEKVPDFRIKILTGEGYMDLSSDKAIKKEIFEAVARKINIQNNTKEDTRN